MVICGKYGINPPRTVGTTERKRQNLPYFGRFIAKSRLNDLEDVGQGQKSLYMTHLLTLVVICAKYGMNPPITVGTTERKRQS